MKRKGKNIETEAPYNLVVDGKTSKLCGKHAPYNLVVDNFENPFCQMNLKFYKHSYRNAVTLRRKGENASKILFWGESVVGTPNNMPLKGPSARNGSFVTWQLSCKKRCYYSDARNKLWRYLRFLLRGKPPSLLFCLRSQSTTKNNFDDFPAVAAQPGRPKLFRIDFRRCRGGLAKSA